VPVGHDLVTFTPAPSAEDPQPCTNNDPPVATGGGIKAGSCALTYEVGTTVTLQAHTGLANGGGLGTMFERWSDDRCGAVDTCTVTGRAPDDRWGAVQPAARVVVDDGEGTLDATPTIFSNFDCTDRFACEGRDYELGSSVSLTAAPTAVTDQPTG
jgi:hypothetical protein